MTGGDELETAPQPLGVLSRPQEEPGDRPPALSGGLSLL